MHTHICKSRLHFSIVSHAPVSGHPLPQSSRQFLAKWWNLSSATSAGHHDEQASSVRIMRLDSRSWQSPRNILLCLRWDFTATRHTSIHREGVRTKRKTLSKCRSRQANTGYQTNRHVWQKEYALVSVLCAISVPWQRQCREILNWRNQRHKSKFVHTVKALGYFARSVLPSVHYQNVDK